MLSKECTHAEFCSLVRDGINVVPGEGNVGELYDSVMFIGRDPGEQENRDVRPFVGDSGRFLRGVIREIFGSDEYVYITNLVKCHTPGNRGPTQNEIQVCSGILINEIRAMRPKVIVALGLDVVRFLLDGYLPNVMNAKMKELSGKSYKIKYPLGGNEYYNVLIVPCYHPSPFNQGHYAEIKDIIDKVHRIVHDDEREKRMIEADEKEGDKE